MARTSSTGQKQENTIRIQWLNEDFRIDDTAHGGSVDGQACYRGSLNFSLDLIRAQPTSSEPLRDPPAAEQLAPFIAAQSGARAIGCGFLLDE